MTARAPTKRALLSFWVVISIPTVRCADGIGNHDGRQTDPSAAIHHHPFTGGGAPLGDHGPEGRGKAAAQAGRGDEVDGLGDSYQVDIGVSARPPVRQTSPSG